MKVGKHVLIAWKIPSQREEPLFFSFFFEEKREEIVFEEIVDNDGLFANYNCKLKGRFSCCVSNSTNNLDASNFLVIYLYVFCELLYKSAVYLCTPKVATLNWYCGHNTTHVAFIYRTHHIYEYCGRRSQHRHKIFQSVIRVLHYYLLIILSLSPTKLTTITYFSFFSWNYEVIQQVLLPNVHIGQTLWLTVLLW